MGVGTTSPLGLLSVYANNGEINTTLFAVGSSTASTITSLFTVSNDGLTTVGDSSGTGDAVFQFASDTNAWSMGYFSSDKTFRIASSTSLADANALFQIGKSGTTTLSSGLGTGTGGNYLCIDTTTFEILRGNGAACTASSLRFKENVADIGYGLNDIMNLHPVNFTYKPEMNSGTSTHLGFIAEEVGLVIPELVTYNNNGEIQGLDYPTVSAVLTRAIQELNTNLLTIASTTASTTPKSQSFAESFFENIFAQIKTWFADAANGIVKFFAKEVHTDTLCIKKSDGDEVCVTGDELANILSAGGVTPAPEPSPAPEPTPEPVVEPTPEPSPETVTN